MVVGLQSKYLLFLVSALTLLSFASMLQASTQGVTSIPVYSAPSPSVASLTTQPGSQRLIVYNTSTSARDQYQVDGCAITHDLRTATSLICPSGVNIPNSVPDKPLQLEDLGSDEQIGANTVWTHYTGNGVTVAVLDTGIDYNSPQLAAVTGNVAPTNGYCFTGDINDCGNGFLDDVDHGTLISGVIASAGLKISNSISANAYNGSFSKGVAPGVQVWMGKVCGTLNGDSESNDIVCDESDIAAGIEYVVDNHIANVISLSIGGTLNYTGSNCDSSNDILVQDINWAYANNVVTVVASGDSAGPVAWPACTSNAIAVGAVNSLNDAQSWSSNGTALEVHGLVAPGVNIYTTYPNYPTALQWSSTGYDYSTGTSVSAPMVAATIALMLQKNPSLTANQIKSIIFSSANCLKNKYGTCPNNVIGYGVVNALAAVTATPSRTTTTTTSTSTSTTSTSTVSSQKTVSCILCAQGLLKSPAWECVGANPACNYNAVGCVSGTLTDEHILPVGCD